MPDKSKPSHIERTVYVNNVSPGDSIRWGSWEANPHAATRCSECYGSGKVSDRHYRDTRCSVCGGSGRCRAIPLTLIEVATGSDYSGSLVEASNARTLKAEFPWLVEISGGHGTFGVAYLGKRENQSDALIEAIDSLTDYPVYSDDDLGTLECERESEAWDERYGGAHDFRKALCSYFDEIDEDREHEIDEDTIDAVIASAQFPRRYYLDCLSSLWDLWREGCEAFNVNGGSGYSNESGDSIYFYIDEWIDSARKPNYPGWPDSFKAAHDQMREALATLATLTRIETHLLTTRGGSACSATSGESNPDINSVTCEACLAIHATYTKES